MAATWKQDGVIVERIWSRNFYEQSIYKSHSNQFINKRAHHDKEYISDLGVMIGINMAKFAGISFLQTAEIGRILFFIIKAT